MHDPDHVVFSIRRPWPARRSAMSVRNELRKFPWIPRAFFARRESRPWWRPTGWYVTSSVWWRGKSYFLPSLITVWHHDPQTDGTDRSCSNRWKTKMNEAYAGRDYFLAMVYDFMWRHNDIFHVRHWRIQWDFAQAIRRRLFTRCAYCGKKGGVINLHMHGWSVERGRKNLHFWESEENLFHWGECEAKATIIMKKRHFDAGPLKKWEKEHEKKEGLPYWGLYSWWRQAVLDEPRELAMARASEHVQRSMASCPKCKGEGSQVVAGVDFGGKGGLAAVSLVTLPCEACDGTGHPVIEDPILEGDALA